MKLLYALLILIIFFGCSFDNKSGIWKNENNDPEDIENSNVFKEFKKISLLQNSFEEIIPIDESFTFKIKKAVGNLKWEDIFYNNNNNLKNFSYNNLNQVVFKSKKLSKYKTSNFLLFENNNLILNDSKGNIIIYSITEDQIVSKFNFYKKRYKKFHKKLNLLVNENVIYVTDNLGYSYAYNYKIEKILWAKNFKIPFRSNLKISKNKLIAASQNNDLYFINKNNGNLLNLVPTEENILKNEFVNNLSISENYSLFYLNSYGSLYSIDLESMRINWFINLNQSSDLNTSNLFLGSQIINNKEKIIISSNAYTYIVEAESGAILSKFNFSSNLKPILHNDYVFFITKKNIILAYDIKKNKIIYSYKLNEIVADYLDTKEKNLVLSKFMLLNGEIFIFLKNSYLLVFEINGRIKELKKLPSKIKSFPIVIDNSLLYINHKKKLVIVD